MNELGRFAALVGEKTNGNKLSWKVAPGDSTFATVIDDVTVQIEYRTFEDAMPDYRLTIRNKAGNEIESYFQERDDADFDILQDLHGAARRNALKIDETLAKLERALKNL